MELQMSMIFPGMDPYLENPPLWSGVHAALIVYIRNQLQPRVRPRYVAAIEERVYLDIADRLFGPDVRVQRSRPGAPGPAVILAECDAPVRVRAPIEDVHETYLTILDREANERVVTVIEVLSPTNKYAGPGREAYLRKQREVLQSSSHLVEIDLLRAGPHVLAVPEGTARSRLEYDYLVCVNRAGEQRIDYELYPWRLRSRSPRIRIPLAGDDPDVPLDIQAVLAQAYEDGAYVDRLRYDEPCVPALPAADQTWANDLIAAARQPGNGAATANGAGSQP
jgi:hypothetical protein